MVRSLSKQFKKTLSFDEASVMENQINATTSANSMSNRCKEVSDVLDLIIKTIELDQRFEDLKNKSISPSSLSENDWKEFTKINKIIQNTALDNITSSPAKYCIPKY
jgi:hypothetical protein